MANLDSSAAVVITRPPEIIACLKLRLSTRNVFIIFDSHPRPSYPNGAGAIVSTSVEGTARRLTEPLPSVDLQDGVLQWQAQLLSNCSGHFFVPHSLDTSPAALWQAVLESSLAQLSMQAEIADLRSQNEFQTTEKKRLDIELKEVEERCQRQERTIQDLRSSRSSAHSHHTANSQWRSSPSLTSRPSSSNNPFVPTRHSTTFHPTSSRSVVSHNPIGVPPPLFGDDNLSPTYSIRLQDVYNSEDRALSTERTDNLYARRLQDEYDSVYRALMIERTDNLSTTYARRLQDAYNSDDRALTTERTDNLSTAYARRLQDEYDREARALTAERTALSRRATPHSINSTSPRSAGQHETRGGLPTFFEQDEDGFLYAKRLQSQFDNEDRALSAERIDLAKNIQPVFECGICMEEMPEDSVARPDPCRHAFCRECMRGYVSARLEEHRFPILCPTCSADKGKGKGVTGGMWKFLPLIVKTLKSV